MYPDSRPLHVLMPSDVFFPRINGVSTSIETFRSCLRDEGVRVTLVAPDYANGCSDPGILRVASWQVPADPEDRLMRWGVLRQLRPRLDRLGADLVHIQTPFAAHYTGLSLARGWRVPVLATYHTHFEEYFHHYVPWLPRPWLRHAARTLARRQCNALDAVVVPSRAMHHTLRGYGVEAPLRILPTGISMQQLAGGDGASFRMKMGIAPSRRVALFVGRVAHEKNIGFLLQAMARISAEAPEVLLLIAGEGPALAELRREVRRRHLDAAVQFVGYLDRQTELPDCYAAADLFVFASRTETQGLVLLEAMAAGVPVYALAEMGARDIIEPHRGAVAAPDEPGAFGVGMLALLRDSFRLADLGREARAFAAEWDAASRAKQLAALYRALLAGSLHGDV